MEEVTMKQICKNFDFECVEGMTIKEEDIFSEEDKYD